MMAMAIGLVVIFCGSVALGSATVAVEEVIGAFANKEQSPAYDIIFAIRLPRTMAAMVLGGALSVSGFLLQVFFGNPIAGPYVLGISSSAKLVVALTMVFLLGRGMTISSFGMVLAAFVGSMFAMWVVLVLAKKIKNMSKLVVCGVMIGYICSAVTDFVVTFAADSDIVNLHNWTMGSFSGTDWEGVALSSVIVGVFSLVAFCLSKPIGAYRLGENYARSLGVNVTWLRCCLIGVSSILSATVTAFAGPISFVGIAVPHLMRRLIKTSDPLYMLPACFLGGALVTLLSDMVARVVFAPMEMSISAVTAVTLAPVVIYLLAAKKEGEV